MGKEGKEKWGSFALREKKSRFHYSLTDGYQSKDSHYSPLTWGDLLGQKLPKHKLFLNANFSPDPGVTPPRLIYHPLAKQLTADWVKAHVVEKKKEMKLSL